MHFAYTQQEHVRRIRLNYVDGNKSFKVFGNLISNEIRCFSTIDLDYISRRTITFLTLRVLSTLLPIRDFIHLMT